MLISIMKAKDLAKVLPLVVKKHQRKLRSWLMFHQCLMVFFLVGFLSVIAAFLFKVHLIGEAFVSLIFFFGALFVLIGIFIETRLISEMQITMNQLLPICMHCKSIRLEGGDPFNQADWKRMEEYFSERDKIGFSHGLCPKCSLERSEV